MTEAEGSDELAEIWSTFLRETSCHGMKNIINSTRCRCIRTLYGLCVVVSLIGLLCVVFGLLTRFTKFGTVTRIDLSVDPNMTFPTVTLCNMCRFSFRGKNKSDPLYRLLASKSVYGHLLPELDLKEPVMEEFLKRTSQDVMEEYSMNLDIHYAEFDNQKLTQQYFQEVNTTHGQCQQFNGNSDIGRSSSWRTTNFGPRSGLRVMVNIKQDEYGIFADGTAGMRVFISGSKDLPQFGSRGFMIAPGTSSYMSVTPRQISFLPKPYASFGSEFCVDASEESPELVQKMKAGHVYSFEKCQEQCVAYLASQSCFCYSPLLVVPDLRACTVAEYIYGCFHLASTQITTNVSHQCDCPRVCSFTQYEVTVSSSQMVSKVSQNISLAFFNLPDIDSVRDNFLEVNIYYGSPLVWREKHEPEYTFHNFMGSLGGQMGLCMGASFITLIEFWELIGRTLSVVCRRLRGRVSHPEKNPGSMKSVTLSPTLSNPGSMKSVTLSPTLSKPGGTSAVHNG